MVSHGLTGESTSSPTLSPTTTGSGGKDVLPHFEEHTPPRASASDGGSLLVDFDLAPSSYPSASSSTALHPPAFHARKPAVSIDDMLGSVSISEPHPQSAYNRSEELLHPTPIPTTLMAYKHNKNLDFSTNYPFPHCLARDLGPAPRKTSPAVNKTASEDGTLHASYYFVHKEAEVALVLFVSNLVVRPQSRITAVIEVHDSLKARFASEEGVEVITDGLRGTFQFSRLSGESTVALCAFLSLAKLGLLMSIKISIVYTNDLNQPKRLQFSLPLSAFELIRPFAMTTDEYGKKWGTYSQPNKIRKHLPAVTSIQALVELMKQQFNIHHIQTIRMEAIAAGRLIGNNDLVLIHGKVASPGVVELSVRASNKLLTDVVSRHAEQVLSSSAAQPSGWKA